MPKKPFAIKLGSQISDTCAFDIVDATGAPVVGILGWSIHPDDAICPDAQIMASIICAALNAKLS